LHLAALLLHQPSSEFRNPPMPKPNHGWMQTRTTPHLHSRSSTA
jgi:hypothetical protein